MSIITVDPQTGNAVANPSLGAANEYLIGPVAAGFRPASSFVINGFHTGPNGDGINLFGFLHGATPGFALQSPPTDPFLSPYLRLIESGTDAVVQFDPSGAGVWSDLVTLKGVDAYTLTWANFLDLQPNGTKGVSYEGIGMLALPSVTGGLASVQQAYPTLAPSGALVSVNLTGGNGPDILVGGRAGDTFHGGGGDDRIFEGGGGLDTAIYDGVIRNYTLNSGGGVLQVSGGPEGGTDSLAFIARAQFVDGYFTNSLFDTAAQVYRVYAATLGRVADPVGLANWTHALNSGASLQSVVDGFVNSTEFQKTYGSLDNTGFVTLLYHNVLHREPDAVGLANWVRDAAISRAAVVTGFSESPENVTNLAAPVQQGLWVQDTAAAQAFRLYDAVLGRLPDAGGLANWTHSLEGGMSLQSAASGFVGSTEFQQVYGSLDNTGFVTLLYHNVLHRAPDQAGLDGWVSQLNAGHSRAEVVLGFSESNEHITNTAAHVDYGIWVA